MLSLRFSIIILLLFWLSNSIADTFRFTQYPEANINFTGRKQDIKEIKQFFDQNKTQVFVLSGTSGIGKTQIAKRYADIYRKQYLTILWVDSSSDIISQLKNFIKKWYAGSTKKDYSDIDAAKDERVIEVFNDVLATSNPKCLVVFDNAPGKYEILKYLPFSKCDIIITTKNKVNWENMKEIQKFKRDESIALLSKFTDDRNKTSLDRLASLLGDYPLAIAQAGSYIKATPNMTVDKYSDIFSKERARLWEYEERFLNSSKESFLDNYQYTIRVTLSINIKAIKDKSTQAYNLLGMFSLMYNENIPEEMIQHYFNNDQLVMGEALHTLMIYSMANLKKGNKPSDNTYSIHEMVQLVVQDGLSESQYKSYLESIMRSFNAIIPKQTNRSILLFSNKSYFITQLAKISDHAVKHSVYNNDLVELYVRKLEYYLLEQEDYNIGMNLIKQIAEIIDKAPQVEKITMARFYLMKSALSAWHLADLNKSADEAMVAEQYLKGYERSYEEWLMLYNRLAQTSMLHGELDSALEYSNLGAQVILNADGYLGNQDSYYEIRARIFEDNGDFKNAYQNIELAIQKAKEAGDTDRKSTSTILLTCAKAHILTSLGEYNQSYSILKASYEKLQAIFGNQIHANYFSTAVMLEMELAFCLSQQGKTVEAEHYVNLGIGAVEKVYPGQYLTRTHAFAYMMLGDIKTKNKKYEEAQKFYLKAEDIYKKILKSLKVDIISHLYKQLAINSAKLKDSYATSYYAQTHINLFGKAHKRSIEIIKYLQDNDIPI